MARKLPNSFIEAQYYEWSTNLSSPNQMSPIFCFLNMEMQLLLKLESEERYCLSLRCMGNLSNTSIINYKASLEYRKSQDITISTSKGKTSLTKSVLLLKFQERNIKQKLIDYTPQTSLTIVFIVNEQLDKAEGSMPIPMPFYSEASFYYHARALSRDFSKLLISDSNYDVEIACDGEIFRAHKNILSCRSGVFRAMLQSDMVESITGRITIYDIKYNVFQIFLSYLYSGIMPQLDVDTAQGLYEIADKYAVEELKHICSQFLKMNMAQKNAYEILILADRHGDYCLKSNVISYIIDNEMPLHDSSWPDFCENQPRLANTVLNICIQRYTVSTPEKSVCNKIPQAPKKIYPN